MFPKSRSLICLPVFLMRNRLCRPLVCKAAGYEVNKIQGVPIFDNRHIAYFTDNRYRRLAPWFSKSSSCSPPVCYASSVGSATQTGYWMVQ